MNPATKINIDRARATIKSTTFTRLPSGTSIVCELTLTNGHTVHGIASVIDFDNYDELLGKQAAYNKALSALLDIYAYKMHDAIATGYIGSAHLTLTDNYAAQELGAYQRCIPDCHHQSPSPY